MSSRARAASSAAFSSPRPRGPRVFGPGVVLAVVQGDQHRGAGGVRQGDVPAQRPGDHLALGRRAPPAAISRPQLARSLTLPPPSQSAEWCGFSQMTVPPMPRPMHMRGQAVADLGVLAERPGQVDHQPHAGAGQRVAEGDRAAVRVDPRIVGGHPEVVEEGQHLDGERLVDLEGADVVDAQPGLGQRLLGGRDRADAHRLGIDAGEGEGDQPHRDRQAELAGHAPRRPPGRPWRRRSARRRCRRSPGRAAGTGSSARPGPRRWCPAAAARRRWPGPSRARRCGWRR